MVTTLFLFFRITSRSKYHFPVEVHCAHQSSLMMPSLRSLILVAFVACACLPSFVVGWGPLSHYYFSCRVASESGQFDGETPNIDAMLIGADLPDGLWNGWFLSGTSCPSTANQMHSPVFAGYLLQEAVNNTDWNTDPYFLSLAYGFATHTIADEVGFASQGGYLGNVSSIIDWSTEWLWMLSVDAFLLQNDTFSMVQQLCPMPSSQPTTPLEGKGVKFIADTNALFNSIYPTSSTLLNATQIQACTEPWAPQVNKMNALANTQLEDATTQQLIFFDRFGASSRTEVSEALDASFDCIQSTLVNYFQLILGPDHLTPEVAWKNTSDYIVRLFEEGYCLRSSK